MMMRYQSLIAVDPSLTCSGWALFSVPNGKLLAVGKIKSLPASMGLSWRIEDLQKKIEKVLQKLELGPDDVLICEAATTMRDPRAAMLVEQVRGLFETVARSQGICVPGRLNPRSIHSEVMGLRGRQLPRSIIKEMAIKVACSVYGKHLDELGLPSDEIKLRGHQDIVDALLLGSLGLTRIGEARLANLSLGEFFDQYGRARVGRLAAR